MSNNKKKYTAIGGQALIEGIMMQNPNGTAAISVRTPDGTIDTEETIVEISDTGCGMDEEMVKRVSDPFVTTRTTRKVGLGISILKAAAQQTGGDVFLESELGVGTTITATFSHSHIDRQPLGDISQAMVSLISMNPDIDFIYTHIYNSAEFTLDTRELKEILGEEIKLNEPSVAVWIGEYINGNLTEIYGGAN